jgi:iron complex outermembrane recepter protein
MGGVSVFKYAYVALASAALSVVVSAAAGAQEAPLTPGGNITAEEATPLPPVVVDSPSEPVVQRKSKGKVAGPVSSGTPVTAAPVASAGEGLGGAPGVGIYTLGQLDMIGGSTITNEAMYTFNRNSLGQAVNILPGVTWLSTGAPSINSSGARAEGDIFVRGFDRFQVPLYIDGVRVYLPADNRIDMNRFLTPDLSEVQVAKGYVPVLNGPGGEGGAINLVSRKPTKEVELEGRVGAVFDGDLGSMGQWNSYAYAGTRQKGYYAQLSGTIVDQDHFDMSNKFTPTGPGALGYANGIAEGFPYENGGNRDRSDFRDWRFNTKVGLTPNATDEYSINYTNQQGEKDAPLDVDRQIVQGYFNPNFPASNPNTVRYWTWPDWDTSSVSWLSKTKLGAASYVKTNAYYNTFENTVSFFTNSSYTNQPVDSPYDDHSVGGFVEMGTDLIPMNTLKGVIHYREDVHKEWNINYNYATTPTRVTETAHKLQSEEGWSFALENTFHATRNLDIVGGVSYDTDKVLQNKTGGIDSPLARPDIDAWNWQTAAIYHYSHTGTVHADVSSRTRFPTLFERYSTRFDAKTDPNPLIPPERATNYELGASDTLFPGLHVSSAVFYSDIKDSIQNAFTGANGMASIVGISPDGHYYGAEVSADWDLTRTLRVGGNYTFIDRDLGFADEAAGLPAGTSQAVRNAVALTQMEGLPKNKAFFYLAWKATNQLTLTPSLEVASDRIALVTGCASTLVPGGGAAPFPISATNGNCGKPVVAGAQTLPSYVNVGSYALINLRADYDFTQNLSAAIGVTNLLDQNYELADGFPEPGRQFYATARAKF